MANRGARFRLFQWCEDEPPTRHKVAVVDGIEGHWGKYTDTCTGCYGDGCSECGFHGKRRVPFWVPFEFRDIEAKEVHDGERCGVCGWWVGHKDPSIKRAAMLYHRATRCTPNPDLRRDYGRRIGKRRMLLQAEMASA